MNILYFRRDSNAKHAGANCKGLFSATEPVEESINPVLLLSLAGVSGHALHVSITLSLLWSSLNPNIEHCGTLSSY